MTYTKGWSPVFVVVHDILAKKKITHKGNTESFNWGG